MGVIRHCGYFSTEFETVKSAKRRNKYFSVNTSVPISFVNECDSARNRFIENIDIPGGFKPNYAPVNPENVYILQSKLTCTEHLL